ncbi:MAG TPA: PIG-L deacetylase family protein, partial [Chroococcales cyanobacterium]
MSDNQIPSRILVIAAHPDDAEWGCGGTIAKWTKLGTHCMCVIATNGDKGDDHGVLTCEQLAFKREEEQRRASDLLGVASVQFLGYRDGELVVGDELRGHVVKWIRRWKPDAVFTHAPDVIFHRNHGVNHSDHRAIGTVTVDAVYPYARGKHQYPEHATDGLSPHTVQELYTWGSDRPNHWEDVTSTMAVKHASLLCHKSQVN